MKDAKELLQKFFLQHENLNQEMKQTQLDIFQLWPQVLFSLHLENLATHSQVLDFSHHHLRLGVQHSVFLQELKLNENLWQPALEADCKQRGFPNYRIQKISYRIQGLAVYP